MTDEDLDGLFPDAEEDAPRMPVVIVPPSELAAELSVAAHRAEELIAGFASGRMRMTDPDTRLELARLHAAAESLAGPVLLVKRAVESAFLSYALDAKAKAIPLPDGKVVEYVPPKGEYVGDMAALRAALKAIALLDGAPTDDEIDAALQVVTTVKADNRKLNAMATKYGGKVADAISRGRQYVTQGDGRVRFP